MSDDATITKAPHALILGGGIAGLAAAIVLARHFDRVTVVEQDQYLGFADARLHTAHGDHIHMLLARGLITLTRFVPKLPQWLDEMGVFEGDLTHHTRVTYRGRWLPQAWSKIPIRSCTRADIEGLLYQHAMTIPNLQLRSECKIQDLLGRTQVEGARIVCQGHSEEIKADYVIDTTGRAAIAASWLKRVGLPSVREKSLDAGIVYVSSWYRPPSNIADDWSVIGALPSFPDHPQMPMFMRVRPDRMICSTAIYGKPTPPRNHQEFLEKIATSDNQHLRRLLEHSTPISGLSVFGNTQNRMRLYSRVSNLPEGLLVLGDAACSLNPRYGQGMTVAAMGIETLDDELNRYFGRRGHLRGFSRYFQKRLEQKMLVPWQTALLEDRAWANNMTGKAPAMAQRLGLRTSQRVLDTAFEDIDTYIRFMRVAQMLDSPFSMLDPRTLSKIARGGRHLASSGSPPDIGSLSPLPQRRSDRGKEPRNPIVSPSTLEQKVID